VKNLTRSCREEEREESRGRLIGSFVEKDKCSFRQVMQRKASCASSIAKENEGKVVVGEDGGEGHFVMARCPRGHPRCHQRHHLLMDSTDLGTLRCLALPIPQATHGLKGPSFN
jgi:hypothetical protein